MDEPKFENASDARVFLGCFLEEDSFGESQEHDLYFDPQIGIPTVIARFGNEGQDYVSSLALADMNPCLAEAKRLSIERGLLLLPDGLDLVLTTWSPMSHPATLVPYLATTRTNRWVAADEFKYEIRLQRWPWKPHSEAGWRWDLMDPDAPYKTRAFGYEPTAADAENIAVANVMAHLSMDEINGPK